MACSYGQTRRAVIDNAPKEATEGATYVENMQFGTSSYSAFSPELSLGVDYLGTMPIESQLETSNLESLPPSTMNADNNDDIAMDPFLSMLDITTTNNKDQWLIPTQQGFLGERPDTPADEGTELAYQKMACFCVSIPQLSVL